VHVKKKLLEMILQELVDVPVPEPSLEQYPTPADIASDLIFQAYGFSDINGKAICEPGCGKGILSLGAGLMGADHILGFDCDSRSVDIANLNLNNLRDKGYEIEAEFFTASIPDYRTKMKWDTIIMNPPFGCQKPGADRPFLEFAAGHCDVMYSLHMANTTNFVIRYLGSLGFYGKILGKFSFPIKYMFTFHKKEKQVFEIALVRGSRKN